MRAVYSASCVTPTREDMSGNTLLVPQASVTVARDGQLGVSRNGELAGGRPTGSDSGVSNNGDAQRSNANACVTRASDNSCDAVSSVSSVTVTRAERKPVSPFRRRGDDPTEDIPGNTLSVPHASVTVARDDHFGVSRDGELGGGRPTGSVPSTSPFPVSGDSNTGDARRSDANACDDRISRGPGRDAPPVAPSLVISAQACSVSGDHRISTQGTYRSAHLSVVTLHAVRERTIHSLSLLPVWPTRDGSRERTSLDTHRLFPTPVLQLHVMITLVSPEMKRVLLATLPCPHPDEGATGRDPLALRALLRHHVPPDPLRVDTMAETPS